MSAISSSLGRVPNLLASQTVLGSITRSNNAMLELQIKMASGRELLRASEDPVGAGTIGALDDVLERRDQRLRNLSSCSQSTCETRSGFQSVSCLRLPVIH